MNRKYVASGFRQDMETLMNKFLCTEEMEGTDEEMEPKTTIISLRFRRFAEIWRSMSFSLIYRLKLNENELREFIDEVYLEVLPNVCAEKPFERRVCALYLLYSLYVKQPKIDLFKQKIRINFSYLEQIRELIAKCKELEQLDVCYVWYKLLSLGAVDMVHVSRLMGPYFIRNSRVTNETQTITDLLIDDFKASVYPPIDELSHIHEKYRTIKEALIEENHEMKTVNQVEDNLFELSKAKMDNLHKEFSNQTNVQTSDNQFDNEFDDSDDQNESGVYDIGSRRRRIREKAAAFGVRNTLPNSTSITETNMRPTGSQFKRRRGRPKVSKLTEIQ